MHTRWVAFAASVLMGVALFGCGRKVVRADAYNDFAIEAAQRGLWAEATLRWEEALKLKPNDPRFLNNLGVAYESQERFDEALEAYRKASAADPNNAAYERNLRRAEQNVQRAAKVEIPSEESEPFSDERDVLP